MPSYARTIAWKSLVDWAKSKKDPHSIIARKIDNTIKSEEAAFARELFFGTIKYKRKIDYYHSKYVTSKNVEIKLKQILRLGFYQLVQTPNIPPYAVVSETVELAKQFCFPKQVGFVNAVMRAYLRQPDKVKLPDRKQDPVKSLGIEYSYPDWLVRRYFNRFGLAKTVKILQWGNTPPELFFYINKYIPDSDNIEDKLCQENIEFKKLKLFKGYYRCLNPHRLLRSNLFGKGLIAIGDPAQSLAASALAVPENELALDLFAAPGGKTLTLAGMVGRDGCVIAVDMSLWRIKILKKNISRWRLKNTFIICCDVVKFSSKSRFKYILVDVPCSGTGTIRRNPDIRWNLQEMDIEKHAKKQTRLIEEAAKMLSPKGRMVYSTCSLEPEENCQIIDNFIKHNKGFHLKDIDGYDIFRTPDGMYEVAAVKHHTDGAFMAVIEKD